MGEDEAAERPEGDLYPEVHLCISCLAENLPTFNFCHDCGAPIDFCASTVPFQDVWAEGWILRAAVAQPTRMIFAGLWAYFGMMLVYYSWIAFFGGGIETTSFGLVMIVACAAVLLRAASNYARPAETED